MVIVDKGGIMRRVWKVEREKEKKKNERKKKTKRKNKKEKKRKILAGREARPKGRTIDIG